MMRSSIRRQILGIAVGLIVLMVIVSALSTVMTRRVAHQLDELTGKYVEANNHLARMQAQTLTRSLELRRMVIAKLQTPPVARQPQPSPFATQPMSAEGAIMQAAREARSRRTYSGDNGDLGLGQRQPTARMGNIDIMSDTMGVDFGPYLQRILHDVKENWYNIIPPSAEAPLYKKGKVSIEFAILKNGQIAGLRYVNGSGDVALDRAAYGGITASTPFPPLPSEFGGQYLGLRFTFLYNPDPNQADLQ